MSGSKRLARQGRPKRGSLTRTRPPPAPVAGQPRSIPADIMAAMTRHNPATIAGRDLPPLAWHHETPFNWQRWQPISDGNMPHKPSGGLWTSPVDDDGQSAWEAWTGLADYRSGVPKQARIIPKPDARVFLIDDHADLLALRKLAPLEPADPAFFLAPIDWETAAGHLDAIWLTARGEQSTRFSEPGLYGWDCATVLWLQPEFTAEEWTP